MAKRQRAVRRLLRDQALFKVPLGSDYKQSAAVDRLASSWIGLPQRPDTGLHTSVLAVKTHFAAVTERLFLLDVSSVFVQAQDADGQIRSARLREVAQLDAVQPPEDLTLGLQLDLTTTGVRLALGHEVAQTPVYGGLSAAEWQPAAEAQDMAPYDLIFRPKHSEFPGTAA